VLVDDLVARFGELEAVGVVSFAVVAGEVFGLLGPNGAIRVLQIPILQGETTASARSVAPNPHAHFCGTEHSV